MLIFKVLAKNLESSFYEREPVDIEDIKNQFLNTQNRPWKQAVPWKNKLWTYCTCKESESLSIENYVR